MPPGRPYIGRLDPVALLQPYFLRGELEAAEVPVGFDGGVEVQPPPRPENPLLSTRDIQRALSELGFEPGPVDGIWGRKTIAAVFAFQSANNLAVDGIVGPKTRSAIWGQLARV
jgi:hypothetical protein